MKKSKPKIHNLKQPKPLSTRYRLSSDGEILYWEWLEQNHPEEFRRRVEEEDYYFELEKQWRASLPKKLDFLLAFPESVKSERSKLESQLTSINKEVRELKNQSVKDYKNANWYEYLISLKENEKVEINKELSRLDWLNKPKNKEETYDIQKAKAFPITNLLQFKRKVALCPFHEDRSPSLHYYEKTNTVYCFACNTAGDSIDVAIAVWGLEWKEAVTKLTN